MKVTILNIPNYYSSYYLLGFFKGYKVQYKLDTRFLKYNNKPLLIFEIDSKIAVIDNDDPVSIVEDLYDLVSFYFVTNKLKLENTTYQKEKVIPLFPHYPVNILLINIKIFNINLFRYLKIKDLLREMYVYYRRPIYRKEKQNFIKDNYVFFSSNIWKKELETNEIRAEFIRFCKSESRVKFEGGFIARSYGNNFDFENEINKVKYKPKVFSKLSAQSKVVLNNPAVCDAVSWRLAEYLNLSLFVLSLPFKIELPIELEHGVNCHFITETSEFKLVFDEIFENSQYHNMVSLAGKHYFDNYCTPESQIKYIFKIMNV
jgi:hypothetical protein